MSTMDKITAFLGDEAEYLLTFNTPKIDRSRLHTPGPDWVDRVFALSDRPIPVFRSLQTLLSNGRLAGTGYMSILPVDQGVEHSAGASFAANPDYFDPAHIVELALEGGCNGVVSTLGALGIVARKYAHKIPFILKINHNELLTFPNKYDQILFASMEQATDMGAVAVGATVYFGSAESGRQIEEISYAFQQAHEFGLATILWAYLRNPSFVVDGKDHHTSADLTGQANHLAATLQADIVKQKLPTHTGGFLDLNRAGAYGKFDERMYTELCSDHPIDLTRYQLANQYMGRIGLINSGGPAGKDDLAHAVRTAVINKRAGGMGLISGRKAFQKPLKEGIALLHTIQDVYLEKDVSIV